MENNKGFVITIILAIIIILLAGYIAYDKILKNDSKTPTTVTQVPDDTTECEETPSTVKGECPLTKFDDSYVLTAMDKEEIAISIISTYSVQNIEANQLEIKAISDSGYYMNVGTQDGFFVYVAKVNDKFKVIGGGGTGDTAEGVERMKRTLIRICE